MTWYEEFYGALDAMDSDRVREMLAADTTLRLGNKEEIVGREAVMEATVHFWETIGGMRHTFLNAVESGDLAALESVVEYTRLDGSKVEIPVTTMIERRDGKVGAQRVYLDVAPLFAVETTEATAR